MKDVPDMDLSKAQAALELDGAAQPGDQALVERMVSAALAAPPPPTMWTRAVLLATASVIVIGGAIGGAKMLTHSPKLAETPADTVVAPQHVVEISPVTTVATSALAPAPIVAASPEVKQIAAPAPVVTVPSLTADELFKKANDTRRHDPRAAVGLYRDLQTKFPASPEAKLSHLTAGRLYLDQLASPADALSQFDASLADGDTFREDALIGRATALERLGRRDDERKAWSTLLSEYPQSVASDHAKSRTSP